jgi:hypothetical protein
MILPCQNCLIKPVCREKTYIQLIDECQILYDVLIKTTIQKVDHSTAKRKPYSPIFLTQLFHTLKPTKWGLTSNSNNTVLRHWERNYYENSL